MGQASFAAFLTRAKKMAEEKRNLEPLDEKDLDLKAKFFGGVAPRKPEGVIAEVKEESVPRPEKRIERKEKISALEPIGKEDIDLKAKFSGGVPPKKTQGAAAEIKDGQGTFPKVTTEKKEEPAAKKKMDWSAFPRMSIMKKETPVSAQAPVREESLSLKEKFARMDEIKKVKEAAIEKKVGSAPVPEAAPEKEEERVEEGTDQEKTISKITVSRPEVQADVVQDAKSVNWERDIENKIEKLVRIAELKGIPHAVKVAKHLDDNYALDEFHDRLLTEELHDALVNQGLIEEV